MQTTREVHTLAEARLPKAGGLKERGSNEPPRDNRTGTWMLTSAHRTSSQGARVQAEPGARLDSSKGEADAGVLLL